MKMHLVIGVCFETPLDAHDITNVIRPGNSLAGMVQPTIEAALVSLFDAPIDERLRIRWRLKGEVDDTEVH
jgi:hypothetical protein